MSYIRNDLPFEPVPFTGERAPWIGGDMQTMRNTLIGLIPPLDTDGKEMLFAMPDGDRLLGAYHKTPSIMRKGLIIIAHGLAGDYDSSYVRYLTKGAMAKGYDALRLNLRGAGKGHNLARSSYHAGRADDLHCILEQMAKIHPGLPLFLCAYSLGGTMAVNVVSRFAVPDNLKAVASFCAPLDMVASAVKFHASRNRLYNRHFTNSLIRLTMARFARDQSIMPDGLMPSRLQKIKSVREFDDLFTSQIAGYRDAEDYYQGTSAIDRLGDITTPTLLCHSDNDPLIPDDAYRKIKPRKPVFCVITRGGGHVGFHGRKQAFDCWQTEQALTFFDAYA